MTHFTFLSLSLFSQGTSRSSKYTILRDDLKLSPDEVQKLCFYSCYNSCRTRNVISQPTPVRYADLLCQRSKNHLVGGGGEEN